MISLFLFNYRVEALTPEQCNSGLFHPLFSLPMSGSFPRSYLALSQTHIQSSHISALLRRQAFHTWWKRSVIGLVHWICETDNWKISPGWAVWMLQWVWKNYCVPFFGGWCDVLPSFCIFPPCPLPVLRAWGSPGSPGACETSAKEQFFPLWPPLWHLGGDESAN